MEIVKKIILLPILFLFSINLVHALLIIEPSSTEVSMFQNDISKQEITITNQNNFTIFNVSFSANQYITYPTIDKLEINQSVKKNVTISPTSLFSRTAYTSSVVFYYLADITLPAITYNITVNDNGFTPTNLFIYTGDSVKWLNNGSLPHTLTHSTFDDTLQPNQSATKTFSSEVFIDYHDTSIGFHGYINITKRPQQFATNPNFNRNFVINLESRPVGATLNGSINPTSYQVRHTQSTDGIIGISNNANVTAINVRFSSNSSWIFYDDNSFNMTPQQNRFIPFHIKPLLHNITESNQTYEFDISILSDNSNTITTPITVFVPFEETLVSENQSSLEDCLIENSVCWIARKEFCDANPYSPACNPAPKVKIVEKPVYIEPSVPYNFTYKDIVAFLTSIAQIKDSQDKTNKFVNDKADQTATAIEKLANTQEEQKNLLNNTTNLASENSQRQNNITTSIFSIATIAAIVVLCGVVYWGIKRTKQKERNIESIYPKN